METPIQLRPRLSELLPTICETLEKCGTLTTEDYDFAALSAELLALTKRNKPFGLYSIDNVLGETISQLYIRLFRRFVHIAYRLDLLRQALGYIPTSENDKLSEMLNFKSFLEHRPPPPKPDDLETDLEEPLKTVAFCFKEIETSVNFILKIIPACRMAIYVCIRALAHFEYSRPKQATAPIPATRYGPPNYPRFNPAPQQSNPSGSS